MFEEYIPYLPGSKDAKVLDIGCGDGEFILFLNERGFSKVSGIDVDKKAIDSCRRKGIKEVEEIEDLCGYLNSNPNKYDFISAQRGHILFPAR